MIYLLLLLISWNLSQEAVSTLPISVRKKVDKTIAAQYPDSPISLDQLNITEKDADLQYTSGNLHLLKVMNNGKLAGYMTISESKGRFENFTYMTIFNIDLSIRTVKVLVYREDYGSEIGHKRWLSQFENKTSAEQLQFEHGVRNISGATLSAKSITISIQELMEGMKRLKRANKI